MTDMVVIGASAGGFQAVATLLTLLDPYFVAPIVIVQHRGDDPEDRLCALWAKKTKLPVVQAQDK